MIKQISLFFLLAFAIFSCCKKKEATPNLCAEPNIVTSGCMTDSNQIKSAILGKWNWTQTKSEAWVEYKGNPCTDTFNLSCDFENNNTVRFFENGNYTSTGTYNVMQDYTTFISIIDTFSSSHSQLHRLSGAVKICGNHLVVDNSAVDGPIQIFVRAN